MAGILEAFIAGKEARRQADAADQLNAMNAFLGQNGAAIMGGDQNVLGQLAGFGPQGLQMAMGLQGDMQARERQAKMDAMAMEDRAYGRERDKITDQRQDQKWEMELAEYKKTISAEQAAAEAAQLENAAKMALTAQTPEQWDELATQNGAPELVGQFENKEAVAAQFMSMAEVLKSTNPDGPEWRPATPEEAAARGGVAGQINDKTGEFKNQSPPSNGITQTIRNPDGTETVIQVGGTGGGSGKPFTEAQSKDNVYATRATGALADLDPVADALTSFPQRVAEKDPTGMARTFQSDEFQTAYQAGREFLASILRKDTGAAVTPSEEKMYGEIFLPMPGDGDALLKQKAKARKRAVEAIKSGMSADQILATERALLSSGKDEAPASGEGPKRLKYNPETGELE